MFTNRSKSKAAWKHVAIFSVAVICGGAWSLCEAAMPVVLDHTDETRVDLIELNHCYRVREQGEKLELAYTQVIFWSQRLEPATQSGLTPVLRVVDFRLTEGASNAVKVRLRRGEAKRATWFEKGRRRTVSAGAIVESWSSVEEDPERLDKEHLRSSDRLELFPEK